MGSLPLVFPSPFLETNNEIHSNCIYCNKQNITGFKVQILWSPTSDQCIFYVGVSDNSTTIPTVWEEVTIASGVVSTHTMTATNKALFYKISKLPTVKIYALKNSAGEMVTPGIRIYDITTE